MGYGNGNESESDEGDGLLLVLCREYDDQSSRDSDSIITTARTTNFVFESTSTAPDSPLLSENFSTALDSGDPSPVDDCATRLRHAAAGKPHQQEVPLVRQHVFICEEQRGSNNNVQSGSVCGGPDTEAHVPYIQNLESQNRPPHTQRIVLVILISFMLAIDTCATTIFVPLVPRYFKTNQTEVTTGILFGAKAVAQIAANPFWGALTDHVGGMPSLLLACVLYIGVMLANAFAAQSGARYAVVVVARVFLGIASAGAATSGPALVATMYTEKRERSKMLGRVLAAYAAGAMAGAPVGGAFSLYDDIDTAWRQPFLILTGLFSALLVSAALLWTRLPPNFRRISSSERQCRRRAPTPMWRLLLDPFIVVMAVMACVANMAVAALDPLLPAWAGSHFTPKPREWQVGLAFLPLYLAYSLTTPLLGYIAPKYDKCSSWALAMGSTVIGAVFILVLPFIPVGHFWLLIVPMSALGIGMGIIDFVTYMVLGTLMDCRHSATYGNVYAIGDIAFSLNYGLAPILATGLAQHFGDQWAFYSLSILLAVCAPLSLCLRYEERHRKPLAGRPSSATSSQSSRSSSPSSLVSSVL